MPALRFPTVPVCQAGDDVQAVSPQPEAAATGQAKRESVPATAAAEQLPRKRVPHRPGAITPRTPLINALASARGAARTPASTFWSSLSASPPEARKSLILRFMLSLFEDTQTSCRFASK